MAKITNQLIETVSTHYNSTTKATSGAHYILKILNENVGREVAEAFREALSGAYAAAVLGKISDYAEALAGYFSGEPVGEDFKQVATIANAEAAQRPASIEDLRFPTPDQWKEFDATLTGPARALSRLIWHGGFKVEDLARDKHKLAKTNIGEVCVAGGLGTTKGRTVTSDNSFGLSEEDYQEVLPVLQGKLFTSEALGLQCLKSIGSITNGWEFTPTQLRVGHAERLLEEGLPYSEVAAIQGISQETLRQRQRKYRKARKG